MKIGDSHNLPSLNSYKKPSFYNKKLQSLLVINLLKNIPSRY